MADPPGLRTSTIRVRDELREAILDGVARARRAAAGRGARASGFGTSRTPVREALLMLEREGLVDDRAAPRRGRARRSTPPTSLDLYEVRALIEPHAARARRHADRRARRSRALRRAVRPRRRARRRRRAAVDDQIALNEEFHRIDRRRPPSSPRLEAAMRAVAGIPRAFRDRVLGATTRSARSRCSATASSCARSRAAQPRARRGRHADAHPRRARVPHGGDP